MESSKDISSIDSRINNVLAVFNRLSSIQLKTEYIKMRVSVKPKSVSQFLYESRADNEKLIFSIIVDASTKKIDVSVNKNDTSLLRCEFRKKLNLVKNNLPDGIIVPFLNEFGEYILN